MMIAAVSTSCRKSWDMDRRTAAAAAAAVFEGCREVDDSRRSALLLLRSAALFQRLANLATRGLGSLRAMPWVGSRVGGGGEGDAPRRALS